MKVLHELEELLDEELQKIVKKGDITPSELDNAYKAVDVLKDIETICAMKRAEEANDGHSEREYSYGTMRHPYFHAYDHTPSHDGWNDGRSGDGWDASHARGRDARGRFTGHDGGSYDRDYSRDAAKDKMKQRLEALLHEAPSAQEREAIMRCIDEM